MKVEFKLFSIVGVFAAIMAVVYVLWTGGDEPVGVVGLVLTAGMCLMISGYLAITARKLDARPDDNPEGEIDEIEGEYGFFSPHSWWPFFLALACAIVFLGVAVGWWLVILGFPMVALATVGWVFEYHRGDDAV